MSGGSPEAEKPTDVQCQNCGRYYSSKGIHSHRGSCPHPDWADPLVPLEDHSPDPPEGSGRTDTSPEPDSSEGSAPNEAVTDGGLGLAGPPEPETTVDEGEEGDDEPARETENCPDCGTDLEATEAELREQFGSDPFRCDECGARLEVGA